MSGSLARVAADAPGTPERVFALLTPSDPTRFYPRFGPLPAVVAVHEQSGDWQGLGQSRRLELSDGGSVVETLEVVDPPARFAYRLTRFTGPFARLVDHAEADWRFPAAESGCRIEWSYRFVPRGPASALIVAIIVRLLWAPYMRRVLRGLVAEVERTAR